MAAEEPFKRYEQAGAAFVNAAVNRLNGLLGGGADSHGDPSGPGEDRPREDRPGEDRAGGRHERTEQLLELIRAEIRSQLTQLGLVTREEVLGVHSRLDDLEARLHDLESRVARLSPPGTAGDEAPGGAAAGGTTS